MIKFKDLVSSSERFQGAKSVYGMVEGSFLGFSTRGAAERAASTARSRPFVVTVGTTGAQTCQAARGRVLNLVELSGETSWLPIARMPEHHRAALEKRWPNAAVLRSVWLLDGPPHLVRDLGLIAGMMTTNRMGVVAGDEHRLALYDALADTWMAAVPVPQASEPTPMPRPDEL